MRALSDDFEDRSCRIRAFVGKVKPKGAMDAFIKVSNADSDEKIAEQWRNVQRQFSLPSCVLIFHLTNHYALVYALREWVDPESGISIQNPHFLCRFELGVLAIVALSQAQLARRIVLHDVRPMSATGLVLMFAATVDRRDCPSNSHHAAWTAAHCLDRLDRGEDHDHQMDWLQITRGGAYVVTAVQVDRQTAKESATRGEQ